MTVKLIGSNGSMRELETDDPDLLVMRVETPGKVEYFAQVWENVFVEIGEVAFYALAQELMLLGDVEQSIQDTWSRPHES